MELLFTNVDVKINRMHEKCLGLVYNGNTPSYERLIEIDNFISVHHRNIQILVNKLYKIVNGLSPDIMNHVFPLSNLSYNTRNRRTFHYRRKSSVTLSHLAPKIWELVPTHMKNLQYVASFERSNRMEVKRLSMSSMPEVHLSGWPRVVNI